MFQGRFPQKKDPQNLKRFVPFKVVRKDVEKVKDLHIAAKQHLDIIIGEWGITADSDDCTSMCYQSILRVRLGMDQAMDEGFGRGRGRGGAVVIS